MASRYLVMKDPFTRVNLYRQEPHYRLLTCLYHEHQIYTGNHAIDYIHECRFHYAHYLAMKRIACSMNNTKVRNRCLFSGNARSVLGMFRMSRFTFKMFARNGRINGVKKSS